MFEKFDNLVLVLALFTMLVYVVLYVAQKIHDTIKFLIKRFIHHTRG